MEYNPSGPWTCVKIAGLYLYDIYNKDTRILGLRVIGWTKTGVLIGAWIYMKVN